MFDESSLDWIGTAENKIEVSMKPNKGIVTCGSDLLS